MQKFCDSFDRKQTCPLTPLLFHLDRQLSFSPMVPPAQYMGCLRRATAFRFSFSITMEIELSKLVGFTDSPQLPMPQTKEILKYLTVILVFPYPTPPPLPVCFINSSTKGCADSYTINNYPWLCTLCQPPTLSLIWGWMFFIQSELLACSGWLTHPCQM